MNDASCENVAERIAADKKRVLDALRKTPIVQVACQQAGVGRTTYYDWRKDSSFAKEADKAIAEGNLFINDLSESQLIALIKDRHFQAIMAWLKHKHPDYRSRLEISGELRTIREELTPEEARLMEEALRLAGFSPEELPSPESLESLTS